MKQLILFFAAALLLVACKEKDKSPFRSSNSPIYIQGVDNLNKSSQQEKLSVHEVLTKFDELNLHWDVFLEGGVCEPAKYFAVAENNIDTINDRLIMEAINVIEEGNFLYEYGGAFLRGRNYYIVNLTETGHPKDTLGYIPNSVIRQAQADILDLWAAGDIAAIYERFNESFYFTPCTAEEFKAQKEVIDWEHEYDSLLPRHAETHLIKWD